MKKLMFILLSVITVFCITIPCSSVAFAEVKPEYRAIYMVDYDTGKVLADENSDDKYPIASMVKIMTLSIIFDEIEKGNLSYDENIRISETAAGMGGSQMFLAENSEYKVTDLIKGIIVCSANDAAVAMGERISGDIGCFVEKMNQTAKEYGMTNTLFCNATGLPGSSEQYSTAKDVTIMMKKVLSHKKYYEYSKIWMENFTHPDGRITEIVNTNKLIRAMPECDAGKTGFTNDAMFCLSASAKSGDTRVIATILGASDSKARFKKVSEMFRYAFANYETKVIIRKNETIPCEIDIDKSKNTVTEIYCDSDIKYFGKKNEKNNYTVDTIIYKGLKAPISKNTPIGEIRLLDENGQIVSKSAFYSKNDIEKMNFIDYFKKVIEKRLFK